MRSGSSDSFEIRRRGWPDKPLGGTYLGAQSVNDKASVGEPVQILWGELHVCLPHQDLEVVQHGRLELGLDLSKSPRKVADLQTKM